MFKLNDTKREVMDIMNITYLKTPLNKYTFKSKKIKSWVELHCKNKRVLNLFAGKTYLNNCTETRNDVDISMNATYHQDALDFIRKWNKFKFDVVVLDPPYSYRKSMEFYNGNKASRFNQLKDIIHSILTPNGKVITFGYHSISMGQIRGFEQVELLIMSHGGAIHDTIAIMEQRKR